MVSEKWVPEPGILVCGEEGDLIRIVNCTDSEVRVRLGDDASPRWVDVSPEGNCVEYWVEEKQSGGGCSKYSVGPRFRVKDRAGHRILYIVPEEVAKCLHYPFVFVCEDGTLSFTTSEHKNHHHSVGSGGEPVVEAEEQQTEGATIRFPEGNEILYGQDFSIYVGVPHDVEFTIRKVTKDYMIVEGPGYGGRPYGNGPLFIYFWTVAKSEGSRRRGE